jgi:hypothetical protein
MYCEKTLFWRLAIASTALLAAVAVYCLARISTPELLAPFQSTNPLLAGQAGLFGSAPSLFYTFAIGLFVGTCASTPASARIHCLIWLGLALLLEISQHPIIAEPLVPWLADTLFVSIWEVIGPYWKWGVFDPLDMIATVAGGLAALTILTHLSTEHYDDRC